MQALELFLNAGLEECLQRVSFNQSRSDFMPKTITEQLCREQQVAALGNDGSSNPLPQFRTVSPTSPR